MDSIAVCDACHWTCVIQVTVRIGHEQAQNICLGCLSGVRGALGSTPKASVMPRLAPIRHLSAMARSAV